MSQLYLPITDESSDYVHSQIEFGMIVGREHDYDASQTDLQSTDSYDS